MKNKQTVNARLKPRAPRLTIVTLVLLAGIPWVAAGSADRVAAGKALAVDRSKGNCLACHRMGDGELPGTLGPPLLAMDLRFPARETLKKQICDATERNPHSRMPPFCRHGILTDEEVDLIVDYLYTL